MDRCDKAIAEVFGLGLCERQVMATLCQGSGDVQALSRRCRKSAPRIAQVIRHLLDAGLVERQQVNLPRGYKFSYAIKKRAELVKMAQEELEQRNRALLESLRMG